MSFEIKIRNATPREGEPLCFTCCNGHVQRGFSPSEVDVYCSLGYGIRRVPFRVRECSDYENRSAPRLYQLEEIAVDLNMKPVASPRPAGFPRRNGNPLKDDDSE